eukprot:UN08822
MITDIPIKEITQLLNLASNDSIESYHLDLILSLFLISKAPIHAPENKMSVNKFFDCILKKKDNLLTTFYAWSVKITFQDMSALTSYTKMTLNCNCVPQIRRVQALKEILRQYLSLTNRQLWTLFHNHKT